MSVVGGVTAQPRSSSFASILIQMDQLRSSRMANTAEDATLLGPFVGYVTHASVKLWLYLESEGSDRDVFVTLELRARGPKNEEMRQISEKVEPVETPEAIIPGIIRCLHADLGVGVVTIEGLEANAKYAYQLWLDAQHKIRLDLKGLRNEDLFFWTLPEDGYGRQLDFLLMSCHDPGTATSDGFQGFAVWKQIPEIIQGEQNANVRFAILAGDQVYADEVETNVLKEKDPDQRRRHYLTVYKKFWNNEYYRRVLCRLPAVLMWDDHDITDGWGSREDSFKSKTSQEFAEEWQRLFETASGMFRIMQSSRNPDQPSADFAQGFDTCFKVGRAGFAVADLRSNRNIRLNKEIVNGKVNYIGQIWRPEQRKAIANWVSANREDIDTLFFVSSVVFSHGAPVVERLILRMWFRVIDTVNLFRRFHLFKKAIESFNNAVGDLRDDINDSWGSDANRDEAEQVLDFLFGLENPGDGGKSLNVVILSGDIHTPGYSTIYSSNPNHAKAVIPHIVATPVAYQPFSWIGEAIFRHLTRVVELGRTGTYTSQISHHFCYRNVVVVSLRNYQQDESHLKVKYYLEGFPEPQVMLFDLNHGNHVESIHWPAAAEPAAAAGLDLPEVRPD
jgi:phosphodiesterase/alkaline phosphatase D-like protein